MIGMRQWGRRLRGLFLSKQTRDGLEGEIRFHIEMETEKYVSEGMDRVAARKKACLAFGGQNALREEVRDELGWAWLGDFVRDLGFGLTFLSC